MATGSQYWGAVLIVLCWLFPLRAFGQAGEGGNISLILSNPSPANSWDSHNCNRESNKLWVGFSFDSKKSAYEIGSLFESQFFSGVESLVFEREFGDSLLVSVTLCVPKLTESNMLSKKAKARIGTLPLFWLQQDSMRPNNSFLVPIDIEPNIVNRRNTGLISSHHIADQNILQSGVALFNCPTLDSFNGKRECFGHFIFYDQRERRYRCLGANLTVYDSSPSWEVVEHSPAVLGFRALNIDIGKDILAPQKEYLEHCSSGSGFAIGPDHDSGGRHDIHDSSGSSISGKKEGDKKWNCKIAFTH